MPDSPPPEYHSVLISAAIMALGGWLGIYLLVTKSLPTVGPRWLLFFLWTLAATGTSLPFVWLLQRRFSIRHPPPSHILLRQGLEIGLFASLCLWLQINRSLTFQLALLTGGGLMLIEWLLRLIERSRWRPER